MALEFVKRARAREFAERFRRACDDSPSVPAKHEGRYVFIVKQFAERTGDTISTETVRKWHEGETAPRQEKISVLAEILGVPAVWLQMGLVQNGSGPTLVQQKVEDDWDGTIRVPIRPGTVIRVANVPADLTQAEAQRLANIILAHAVVD